MVVSDDILGHVHFVEIFGKQNKKVGERRLADDVVVSETTTLT